MFTGWPFTESLCHPCSPPSGLSLIHGGILRFAPFVLCGDGLFLPLSLHHLGAPGGQWLFILDPRPSHSTDT